MTFIRIKDYTINVENIAYVEPFKTTIFKEEWFALRIHFANDLTLHIDAKDKRELDELVKRVEKVLK